MHLYRISTLAEGKLKREKYVSLDMILGGHAGDIIHSLLTEKHKGMGRYLEQEQILFLTDKKETAAPILGMISGTPDMFWFEESTLYVEEWKTIAPNSWNNRAKSAWWNQLILRSKEFLHKHQEAHNRQYFSNQLVSTYKDKFKCVAELNEDGRLTWKTTPELHLIRGKEVFGKITRIQFVEPYYYILYLADLKDPHTLFRRNLKAKETADKDTLDVGWKANQWDDTPLRIEFKLVDDVRTLLPKLPHWLAYFYGGWVTVEKEHDYDKEGKINDQSKNLLVKDSSPKRWGLPSPTYTVKSIE